MADDQESTELFDLRIIVDRIERRLEEAGALIADDILDRYCFAGTPEDVADHALELFDAGASRIEFGTPHGLTDRAAFERLGQHVLSRLRDP